MLRAGEKWKKMAQRRRFYHGPDDKQAKTRLWKEVAAFHAVMRETCC